MPCLSTAALETSTLRPLSCSLLLVLGLHHLLLVHIVLIHDTHLLWGVVVLLLMRVMLLYIDVHIFLNTTLLHWVWLHRNFCLQLSYDIRNIMHLVSLSSSGRVRMTLATLVSSVGRVTPDPLLLDHLFLYRPSILGLVVLLLILGPLVATNLLCRVHGDLLVC